MTLRFARGTLYEGDHRVILFPMNSYMSILYHILKTEREEVLVDAMRKASFIDTYLESENLKNIRSEEEKIRKFLDFVNSLGMGEISFKARVADQYVFVQKRIHLSEFYRRMFGNNPNVLWEEVIAGYLQNFLEIVIGKKT